MLSVVLKNISSTEKSVLMNYLSWDVDFNATIKEAFRLNDEYITKKLYDMNFFIIGVYEDEKVIVSVY